MNLKLGKKPAVFNRNSVRSAVLLAEHLADLGSPPVKSDDWAKMVEDCWGKDWGMYLNDQLGCCTVADGAHQIMLHTANANFPFRPSDDDVLDAYKILAGYDPNAPLIGGVNSTDNGATEMDACAFMRRVGIAGHRSDGYASVDPARLDHVRWAIQLFGSCRIGLNVTQGMLDQFEAGHPWDGSGSDAPAGGHDVPIITYDADFFWLVTWGKLHPITPAGLAKYCDEAHAEIYADWIKDTGVAPSGFNLGQLLEYLNQLN